MSPASQASLGNRCYRLGMKRVLLTGMSGTGKSTMIDALAQRGFKAVDADDPDWSEPVAESEPDGRPSDARPDVVWREDRLEQLLATEDADLLFVGGCATNQDKFYPQFDYIVLLTAPVPVTLERLATKATDDGGTARVEVAQVIQESATVEPLLKRRASLEVDTSAPVEQVVDTILDHVE